MNEENIQKSKDFIRTKVEEDLKNQKVKKVVTRFPPEPNGYLHIGHAKSICLNFGVANEYNGECNLRMDDTNPTKEEDEYVASIQEDVKWLGFDWDKRLYFASDYFDKLYSWAVELIKKGKAYVCDLSAEEVREMRGTLKEAGKNSPYRNRSIQENLELFEKMKNGEFEPGSCVLRAKIDMASPNFNLRDPAIYRVIKAHHHRTGDKWCIYPMYDFAHGLSDAIEGVTHSLCTLEFEDHRPLYDWFLDNVSAPCHPLQIEFARLNLTFTVLSKRKLLKLVNENYVSGWDDPRMPTISALRRRGYPPLAIKDFAERIGIGKTEGVVDVALLEYFVRQRLNLSAPRFMAVLNPLKVTIENYPGDNVEELDAVNNPEDPTFGMRKVPFSKIIYIERDDFMEDPPKKFFRLSPGKEVRLRYAYFIKCERVIKDDSGNITEIICTYDPETKGGNAPDNRKVKATLHWVCAKSSFSAEVRLYDRLFKTENPEETENKEGSFIDNLNEESLVVLKDAKIEPAIKSLEKDVTCQFERLGYFCLDAKDTSNSSHVFNRTVTLKDQWEKIKNK
jgi:glutaminyl-tRNA synthetase